MYGLGSVVLALGQGTPIATFSEEDPATFVLIDDFTNSQLSSFQDFDKTGFY